MSEVKHLEEIMGLIMYGGEAKGQALEAINYAKNFQFDEAKQSLEAAEKTLVTAHKSQTTLLSSEAAGDNVELSLLMVHGQDHLMTSLTFLDLAKEVVGVYEKIAELS